MLDGLCYGNDKGMPESGGLTKCHSAFPLRGSIGVEFSRCGSGCEVSARLFCVP